MAQLWHPIPSRPGYIGSCSGSVVAANVILTAAHCVVDESTGIVLPPGDFHVYTGSVNLADAHESRVARVIKNPNYSSATETSDIALLVLAAPISSPHIQLAGPSDEYLTQAGTGGRIAGWGNTYSGEPTQTQVLRWASTVVQSGSTCAYYDPIPFNYTLNLCAVNYPYDNTATCQGDSGGPLIANAGLQPVELGVTDYGDTGCPTSSPSYFANVISLRPWIEYWISAVTPKVTSMTFTYWRVFRYGPRYSWWTNVHPGGSLYYCAGSTKVLHLRAYYLAVGPTSGPDSEVWDRNGAPWGSYHDAKLGPSGYFYTDATNKAPIRPGTWVVRGYYQGRLVGTTSLKLVNTC